MPHPNLLCSTWLQWCCLLQPYRTQMSYLAFPLFLSNYFIKGARSATNFHYKLLTAWTTTSHNLLNARVPFHSSSSKSIKSIITVIFSSPVHRFLSLIVSVTIIECSWLAALQLEFLLTFPIQRRFLLVFAFLPTCLRILWLIIGLLLPSIITDYQTALCLPFQHFKGKFNFQLHSSFSFFPSTTPLLLALWIFCNIWNKITIHMNCQLIVLDCVFKMWWPRH